VSALRFVAAVALFAGLFGLLIVLPLVLAIGGLTSYLPGMQVGGPVLAAVIWFVWWIVSSRLQSKHADVPMGDSGFLI
jgi:hypothetical protein